MSKDYLIRICKKAGFVIGHFYITTCSALQNGRKYILFSKADQIEYHVFTLKNKYKIIKIEPDKNDIIKFVSV